MEEVIKGVYETNFGTACEVYKDAVKKRSTRLKDAKSYLSPRQDKQTHLIRNKFC